MRPTVRQYPILSQSFLILLQEFYSNIIGRSKLLEVIPGFLHRTDDRLHELRLTDDGADNRLAQLAVLGVEIAHDILHLGLDGNRRNI